LGGLTAIGRPDRGAAAMIDESSVLLVVDLQYDFMPGGSLAVPDGDAVVPIVNRVGKRFVNVVLTQDWHPRGHASFASAHPGKKPFETTRLAYGEQVVWPDHCIQGTSGAALHEDLELTQAQLVIRKGFHPGVDSYSAFYEADRRTPTGLAGYLDQRGLKRVFLVGLATDFCVAWSAIDAANAEYETYVIEDACRAIDLGGSLAKAWADMAAVGVHRLMAAEIVA
jgi:nicotinamidase/pyrazinamidase